MAENELHNPKVHHEASDVDIRAITRYGVIFSLALVASLVLVWFVFNYLKAREDRLGTAPSTLVRRDARSLPPEPRLQSSPILDLQQMQAAENQLLDGYAWVDPANGIVRIPVNRALDLVAREGLPHRTQAPPPAASSASVPTESGLGVKTK